MLESNKSWYPQSASKVTVIMVLSELFSIGIKPRYGVSFPFAIARSWDFFFFPSLKKIHPNTSCVSWGLSAACKISVFLSVLFQNGNLIHCKRRWRTICVAKKNWLWINLSDKDPISLKSEACRKLATNLAVIELENNLGWNGFQEAHWPKQAESFV